MLADTNKRTLKGLFEIIEKIKEEREIISEINIEGTIDLLIEKSQIDVRSITSNITLNPYNSTLTLRSKDVFLEMTYDNIRSELSRKGIFFLNIDNNYAVISLKDAAFTKNLSSDNSWLNIQSEHIKSLSEILKFYDRWTKEGIYINRGNIYFAETPNKTGSFIIIPEISYRRKNNIQFSDNIIIEFATYKDTNKRFEFNGITESIKQKEQYPGLYIHTFESKIPFDISKNFISEAIEYIEKSYPIEIKKEYYFQ